MKTYAEWVKLLEEFENGMDASLNEMENSTFDLDAGTAGRFLTIIKRVYQTRKQKWIDDIQRSIDLQNMKSIEELDIIIRQFKTKLIPLQRFSHLKVLPEEFQKVFKEDLKKIVEELKQTLEKSAIENLDNKEQAMFYLRNLILYDINPLPKDEVQNEKKSVNSRRIIF